MRLFLLYFVYIRAASWRTGKNTWFCFGLLASCFLELCIWKLSGKVWSLPFLSILAITCSLKLNHIHKLRPSAWPLGAFPFAGPESHHASTPKHSLDLEIPQTRVQIFPLSCTSSVVVYLQLLSHRCSVAQLCPTLCNPVDCSMPGFPVLRYLPEFAQTHVHWVNGCHPTISFSVASFSTCLQSFPASGCFSVVSTNVINLAKPQWFLQKLNLSKS